MRLRYPSGAAKVNLAGFLLGAANMVPDRVGFAATGGIICSIGLGMHDAEPRDSRLRAEALLILLLQAAMLVASLL